MESTEEKSFWRKKPAASITEVNDNSAIIVHHEVRLSVVIEIARHYS